MLAPFGEAFVAQLRRIEGYVLGDDQLPQVLDTIRCQLGSTLVGFPNDPIYFGLPDKVGVDDWQWSDPEVQDYVARHAFGGGFGWTYLFPLEAQSLMDTVEARAFSEEVEEVVRLGIDSIQEIKWFALPWLQCTPGASC